MSGVPTAKTDSSFRIAPVWIIPGLCAAMVLFFAVQHAHRLGAKITIHFSDAAGVIPGKTMITLRGVRVGRVIGMKLTEDGVDVAARLDRDATPMAREKTVFITVKPELGFEGVRGLTTLFSGPSIEMRPGAGEPAKSFNGYPD